MSGRRNNGGNSTNTRGGGRGKAAQNTQNKPANGKSFAWRTWLACIVIVVVACLVFFMHIQADIIHVRTADIVLDDLPQAFDGKTILFASDIDLGGLHTAKWFRKTFLALEDLHPDMLILGGDYNAASPIDKLLKRESSAPEKVFAGLWDFNAPMGKFAIAGDKDTDVTGMDEAAAAAGFVRIDKEPQAIREGESAIALFGLPEGDTRDLKTFAANFGDNACVIGVTHSPETSKAIRMTESADGGRWCDLILCGHTHGGLIKPASGWMPGLTDYDRSRLYGIYGDKEECTLVTSGMGATFWGVRLGTQSEVWLLTLRCA